MHLCNAIEAMQMALGPVPEILDPVDVVSAIGKQLRMVDPHVMEAQDDDGNRLPRCDARQPVSPLCLPSSRQQNAPSGTLLVSA